LTAVASTGVTVVVVLAVSVVPVVALGILGVLLGVAAVDAAPPRTAVDAHTHSAVRGASHSLRFLRASSIGPGL
jgi:hypothetical protein